MTDKPKPRSIGIFVFLAWCCGAALGGVVAWLVWGVEEHAPAPVPAAPAPQAPREKPPVAAVAAPEDARGEERAWLKARSVQPVLAYLFSADNASLEPLGGRLARHKGLALEPSGHVYLTGQGAVFMDGSRLLSGRAGRELSLLIRTKDMFSVEAVILPADKNHSGPARIVGISFDGGQRNFTLGQEQGQWAVRLRTTQTGANGTNPEVRVPGLEIQLTHVAVTYDGRTERVFVNGKEATARADVAGELSEWSDGFPLVMGNEAYDVRNWEGVLRFVAFYDTALSADKVAALAADLPKGDPPLGHTPAPPPGRPSADEAAPAAVPEDIF